jgi:hypothetical protein
MTARVETILAPLDSRLVQRPATLVDLADAIAVPAWDGLLRAEAGWLQPVEDTAGRARITPRDSRPQPVLTGDLAGAEPLIEAILDLGEERIGVASTAASFAATQQLRSGWLKLRHDDQ